MPPTFGRYELLKRLAGGGMGEVFLARQRGLAGFEKLLVIKTLLPHLCEEDEFINMFQDEARLTAQLIHPNICQTFEFDRADGSYYIAMEYLRGEDVRRLWRAAANKGLTIPVALICRVVSDAASGLDFAHGLKDSTGKPYGIVHRDISPQNILVTFEGGVKIIDFGVAKAAGRLTQTRTGALKGKYSYMSPEQVAGRDIDHRTDIFALGVVLHELLTGVRLFKSDSDIATIERVKSARIPPPSEVNPLLPQGLDAIVLKALHRDPAQRFQTAQQFRLALEDWLVQERMSASSAHLAEFLKQVYRERLALEAQKGPLLGEAPSQSLPIGARPSSTSLPAVRPGSIEMPPAGEIQATQVDAPRADATRAERDRTPSKSTNSRPEEPSGSAGPFKGKPRVKLAVAAGSAVAIIALAIAIVVPRGQQPAAVVTTQAAAVPIEPKPAAASPVYTLLIKSEPEGAEVSEGARILGRTPFNWSAPRGEPRTLTFRLDGYRQLSQVVSLTGAESDLAVRLQKIETPRPAPARKPREQQQPPDQAIKLER